MPESRPPQEIADIVDAVANRDPDMSIVDAVSMVRAAGFLSIGTALSEAVHMPVVDQKYTDRNLGHDVLVDEPGVAVLQATWSGKIAVMCGVFGDINMPNQRRQLSESLTDKEHVFGWFNYGCHTPLDMYGDEDFIGTQADRELLHAVQVRGDAIRGAIDLVAMDGGDFYIYDEKPEPDESHSITRPGIVLTRHARPTVATLPVFGSDLWATGIIPIAHPSAGM